MHRVTWFLGDTCSSMRNRSKEQHTFGVALISGEPLLHLKHSEPGEIPNFNLLSFADLRPLLHFEQGIADPGRVSF